MIKCGQHAFFAYTLNQPQEARMPIKLNLSPSSRARILVIGRNKLNRKEMAALEAGIRPLGVQFEYQFILVEPETPNEWLRTVQTSFGKGTKGAHVALAPAARLLFMTKAILAGIPHVVQSPLGDYLEFKVLEEPLHETEVPERNVVALSLIGELGHTQLRGLQERFRYKGGDVHIHPFVCQPEERTRVWPKFDQLLKLGKIRIILLGPEDIPFALEHRTIFKKDLLHLSVNKVGQVKQWKFLQQNLSEKTPRANA